MVGNENSMPRNPVVSVLMSVYNDERFLKAAVESILAQSYTDLEFVIIDDGSSDGSAEVLRDVKDARLKIAFSKRNWGLTASLNRGMRSCRGKYLARIDSDDIADPERLRRQVDFLEKQADIGIVGSSRLLIDEAGQVIGCSHPPADDLAIRWKSLLGNPFGHPTIMLRMDLLKRHRLQYDRSFRTAQDYELWTRLLRVTRGANLREPLVRYRLRRGSSRTDKTRQLDCHDRIAALAIRRMLPEFPLSDEQVKNLRGRYGGHSVRDPGMNPLDPPWRQLYLSMFDAFGVAFGYEPSLLPLRWQVQWNTMQPAA